MLRRISSILILLGLVCTAAQPFWPDAALAAEDNGDFHLDPPFLTAAAPPLVMLVMGRDHKLYVEAYNDTSDLDGDGDLDVGYNPTEINYYGYFDSYKCYEYNAGNQRFEPVRATANKQCVGINNNRWSGDWLNYVTMSRMDAMRKVLYGGYRSTDTATATVLERAYIPQEAHTWGKEYRAGAGYDIREYTPLNAPAAGTGHLFVSTTLSANGNPLLRILTNKTNRIWEWASKEQPVGDNSLGVPTDYVVRVEVCDDSMPEINCKGYPGADGTLGTGGDDAFKPIGLLQRYGENDQMLFGLLTGSYAKHLSGGVLRKNIGSITNEINANTGEFLYQDNGSIQGIVKTIDNFSVVGFNYTNYYYDVAPVIGSDSPIYNRQIVETEYPMWGNPIGEMMYEALRYFSATPMTPTSDFNYSGATIDSTLGLPLPAWGDPYGVALGNPTCGLPFMLVISDISPSFDSDQLPGSAFNAWANSSLSNADNSKSLNVATELTAISTEEKTSGDLANSHFLGQTTVSPSNFDTACSAKAVGSLSTVRGLCPEEPTKQGSYYSAAVAYFGHEEDLSSESGDQKVTTFAVGLSSPLPRIEIPVAGQTITLVPFAKSIYGTWGTGVSPDRGDFQPSCALADFYVENITPTSGSFRVNFEHAEQGSDYDMDVIVYYRYTVNADDTVDIQVYCDPHVGGSTKQHIGYIISGTTADGVYLEVTSPNSVGDDRDYYLDTPPGIGPNQGPSDMNWQDAAELPCLDPGTTRNFTASGSPAATLVNNPLWYAAKWGGFRDLDGDHKPDLQDEWDEDGDGRPDTYFYVQNPLKLYQELSQAFLGILERASSGTAASVIASSRSGEGAVYQALFFPYYKGEVRWTGEVHALLVDAYGNMREDTPTQNQMLDLDTDRIVRYSDTSAGEVNLYIDDNADGQLSQSEISGQTPTVTSIDDVAYLWSSSNWLNEISDTNILTQRTYDSTDAKRYIFTFVDQDGDMVVDAAEKEVSGEPLQFTTANRDTIKPYLHLFKPFTTPPVGFNENAAADLLITWVRGRDNSYMRSRQVDYDSDGTTETFRLGDIVHSTPTAVARPAENYDLLYRDASYQAFYKKYRNRRTVIYVGANDGMLHAFNGGFFTFDSAQGKYKFVTQLTSETAYEFGAEMWAYVPFNALPHLVWLASPTYKHVYYCDLKPRVFDARIYDHTLGDNDKHPRGWATILVTGMRFGGSRIRTDKNHDGIYDPNTDVVMKSSYSILDITDPEEPPELLAEITFDDLGYTTSYPGVILLDPRDTAAANEWYLVLGSGPNGMRVKYTIPLFAGMPAGATVIGATSGATATILANDTTNEILSLVNVAGSFEHGETVFVDWPPFFNGILDGIDPRVTIDLQGPESFFDLSDAASSQPARLYAIDLKDLVQNGVLEDPDDQSLPGAGPFTALGDAAYDFADNSYISDIISVDLDLDYTTDALYYGTTSGSPGSWGGKMRRIVLSDPENGILPGTPGSWDKYSTLFDAGRPITAAPAVAMDRKKQPWIFFGTGRFINRDDVGDSSQQTYYGIKEPWQDLPDAFSNTNGIVDINVDVDGDSTVDNEMTWAEVSTADLMDVSDIVVYESGNILYSDDSTVADLNSNNLNTFSALDLYMDQQPTPRGWKLHFGTSKERNLGQGALLGDILSFTSYVPNDQTCQFEGDSYLYAVYYKTGTAFSSSVIGFGTATDPGDGTSLEVSRKKGLGKGLAITPNIHTGREKGSKAYIQTSTGAIVIIGEENPGSTKTGKTYWMEE